MNLFNWKKKEDKPKTVDLTILSYNKNALEPVFSENSLKCHYDKIAKNHVMAYNSSKNDFDFDFAGAKLHNMFFAQFKKPNGNNLPSGIVLDFIIKHFKTFQQFKESIALAAAGLKGSGWVYLSKSGIIKTIKNNEWFDDIVFLIDCWEHAYILDYGYDRRKYIETIWRIIDWAYVSDVINFQFKTHQYQSIDTQSVIIP